jgi:hypothetical protein
LSDGAKQQCARFYTFLYHFNIPLNIPLLLFDEISLSEMAAFYCFYAAITFPLASLDLYRIFLAIAFIILPSLSSYV